MQEQMETEGYCSDCKKTTKWIKQLLHRGGQKKFICCSEGCYNQSDNPRKEREIKLSKYYYIGAHEVDDN